MLSKTPKPVTLALEGKISEPGATGERPSALKTLSLRFDKNGAIFTKGLATCRLPRNPDINMVQSCRESLVGHGEVELEVRYPEQPAIRTKGPLLIYNGLPKHGRPVLIYHLYADVPAPTTFLAAGVIEKDHGKFGTETAIEIPTIVGGQSWLTRFKATIGKTWTYKGNKVSLLMAKCPKGSIFARGEFTFANGARLFDEIAKSCG